MTYFIKITLLVDVNSTCLKRVVKINLHKEQTKDDTMDKFLICCKVFALSAEFLKN